MYLQNLYHTRSAYTVLSVVGLYTCSANYSDHCISLAARSIWAVLNLAVEGGHWDFYGFCIFKTCSFKFRRMTSCHPWAFSAIQDGAQDGCQHKVGLIKQDTTEVFKILFLFQAIKCIAEMSNLWFMSIWCLLVLILWSNMATKMNQICSINHSFDY